MADAENPPLRRTLPVTAEVGSEGGSYAEATVQAETFGGDNEREQPEEILADTPADDDTQESPAQGIRKYPSE